jgi:hypothetical protein
MNFGSSRKEEKVFVAHLKLLSWHFCGGSEEEHGKYSE